MSLRGFAGIGAVAIGFSSFVAVEAQDPKSTPRPATSKTTPTANGVATGGSAKLQRPQGEPLRVNNVTPELRKILKDWEVASSKVKKLEGKHRRWEYDYVFAIVKQNTGAFYYEAPDKGRIDLEPIPNPDVPKNAPPPMEKDKKHWLTQQPTEFKLQPGPAERWYCDGKVITQVDVETKTATKMVIPPQAQGEHIADGPLPFLFGMPAEKAIQRYDMRLLSEDKKKAKAWIEARPRWDSDRANYQRATIILDLKTFLPDAVQLIDPAGTKETAYKFGELEVNSKSLTQKLFRGDPFKFNDKSYKIVIKAPTDDRAEHADGTLDNRRVTPAGATKPANPTAGNVSPKSDPTGLEQKPATTTRRVPSLIGLEGKKAKEILEQLGFEVVGKWGSDANREEEVFRVERQSPEPKSMIAPGETVTLWMYKKPK